MIDVIAVLRLDLLEEGIMGGVSDLDAVEADPHARPGFRQADGAAHESIIDPYRRVGHVRLDPKRDRVPSGRHRGASAPDPCGPAQPYPDQEGHAPDGARVAINRARTHGPPSGLDTPGGGVEAPAGGGVAGTAPGGGTSSRRRARTRTRSPTASAAENATAPEVSRPSRATRAGAVMRERICSSTRPGTMRRRSTGGDAPASAQLLQQRLHRPGLDHVHLDSDRPQVGRPADRRALRNGVRQDGGRGAREAISAGLVRARREGPHRLGVLGHGRSRPGGDDPQPDRARDRLDSGAPNFPFRVGRRVDEDDRREPGARARLHGTWLIPTRTTGARSARRPAPPSALMTASVPSSTPPATTKYDGAAAGAVVGTGSAPRSNARLTAASSTSASSFTAVP